MNAVDKIREDIGPEDFGAPAEYAERARLYANWLRSRPPIAPPVAAGSVDIAELRLMLIDHRHSDSRKEQDRHLDSIIYFVNAWAAQHVANAIKDQKERAEKAEARVKELERSNLELNRVYEERGRQISRLEREPAAKQAIIDRLMLEYCPDEMTVEQMAEWASHQKCAE